MIKHISASMIAAYGRCPEQFRRSYMLGDRRPPGIAAIVGRGVHKGAEVNHRAKLTTRRDEPLDVVTDAARDGYRDALQEGVFFPPDEAGTAKRQMAEGADTTVSLAATYHAALAPQIQPLLVEQWINIKVEELPLPVVGIIDVLDENDWLPDIKTAGSKWSQGKADGQIQAMVYPTLVKSYTGRKPKKVSFEVLVNNKKPTHQSLTVDTHPEDWDVFVLRAQAVLSAVKAGTFPPADPGSWCCSPKWCGYWWDCPYVPKYKKEVRHG